MARLQEEGVYLASVRTFYRVGKEAGKLHHRGNTRPACRPYTPPELQADGPDQVYSWDITWLPSTVRGLFWYGYSYHGAYPGRFGSVGEAREWMGGFIDWYNMLHRHSGIGIVTPEQRRRGEDKILFEKRNRTLREAGERLKQRFPKTGPKLWAYKRVVYLNPSQETRNYLWRKAS